MLGDGLSRRSPGRKERRMRMRRIAAVLVTVAAAVLVFSVSTAPADNNGATINKDFTCFVFVAPIAASTTDQSLDVDTSSGNTNLVCHFKASDFVGPLPTEVVKLTDVPCTTFAGNGI